MQTRRRPGRVPAWIAALPKDTVAVLVVLVAVAVALLASGRHDYPALHVILDATVFFLSALLALLLRDIGHRLGRAFPLWLSVGFAATAGLEVIHVSAVVEWWGLLSPIAAIHGLLRPATWPPSVHLLPISIGAAIWLLLRGEKPTRRFAPAIVPAGGRPVRAVPAASDLHPRRIFSASRDRR